MTEPRSEQDVPPAATAGGPLASGGLLTSPLAALEHYLGSELSSLEAELDEIGLLANQARMEAARHEEKRGQAATRLESIRRPGNEAAALETAALLATLTRRAAVMQAQVDVLEGKLKVLGRYRDSLAATATRLSSMGRGAAIGGGPGSGASRAGPAA
ncbi:MAG: hypothetical protein FJ038_01790, partial [Chloroflexi bacterium]|nr:hypothetical protein [Chloroflexota bacterium]